MEPSGLGLLFQNLGPATASMVAGGRDAQAEQAALLQRQAQQQDLERATLANQFARESNPERLRQLQLGNTGQEQINTLNQVKADSAVANKDVAIAADRAKYTSEQMVENAKSNEALGRLGVQLAPQLAAIPDAQKPAAVSAFLQQNGINPNSPTVQGIFGQIKNIPPAQWPKLLETYGNKLVESSASYMQAKMQKDSAERVAQIHANATLASQRMSQDGQDRRAAAKSGGKMGNVMAAIRSGKLGYEKAAQMFASEAEFNPDLSDEEREQYKQMAQKFAQEELNKRNAGANGRLDVGSATGMPTQTVTPNLGGGPKLGTAQNPIVLK